MAYLGKTPSQAVRQQYFYTATGGETSLSGADDNGNTLTYTDGAYVDVFLNGILLVSGTDYNTTTANTIGGLTALSASDVVEIVVYDTFAVFGGEVQGDMTVTNGTLSAEGITGSGDMNIDNSTLFVDASADSVGIGTSSPATSSSDVKLTLDSTAGSFVNFRSNGNPGGAIGSIGSSQLEFFTITGSAGSETFTERMRIDSDGNLCLGVTDEIQNFGDGRTTLAIKGGDSADYAVINLANYGTTGASQIHGLLNFYDNTTAMSRIASLRGTASTKSEMVFYTTADSGSGITEAMRLDSSGNTLVGKSATSIDTVGVEARANGRLSATMDGDIPLDLNRKTSNGTIALFRYNGSSVGSIGTQAGDLYIANSVDVGLYFESSGTDHVAPCDQNGSKRDNAIDLGASGTRFDDVYATNGTIQTSDRNEKQDIATLTTAEMAVAARLSNQFKTFRWIDSVTENGDNARTHTGIIAQDVQQAFTDEGLDAGDYALFISGTWWETQTEVPAVEAVEAQDAVYDEDGNLVSEAIEAVEAQEAYTRTDTYDTADEAPEGATERTRMGIRYPELLSFMQAYNDQRMASIEARLDALEAN